MRCAMRWVAARIVRITVFDNDAEVLTVCMCVFFFQAEDGIRDVAVTGVQTCALPISHELVGMITVKDFQKAHEFPRACKDGSGRLRVGAAVGTTPDTLDRVAALREAGDRESGGEGKRGDLGGRRII